MHRGLTSIDQVENCSNHSTRCRFSVFSLPLNRVVLRVVDMEVPHHGIYRLNKTPSTTALNVGTAIRPTLRRCLQKGKRISYCKVECNWRDMHRTEEGFELNDHSTICFMKAANRSGTECTKTLWNKPIPCTRACDKHVPKRISVQTLLEYLWVGMDSNWGLRK